ncbi:hypothetical protein GGR46_005052 [Sphingomonas kyeonggiensis]|uniref:Uncharacterized protein n=1 Tax=Sphingomonas kyeonggiensis TaxID=1268553 RepID=A0A7W6JXM5_9SPHN|nr:hypothetical protein [Sphingomonas kyeonggiensis]
MSRRETARVRFAPHVSRCCGFGYLSAMRKEPLYIEVL